MFSFNVKVSTLDFARQVGLLKTFGKIVLENLAHIIILSKASNVLFQKEPFHIYLLKIFWANYLNEVWTKFMKVIV